MTKYYLQVVLKSQWLENSSEVSLPKEVNYAINLLTTAQDLDEAKAKFHRYWLKPLVEGEDTNLPLEHYLELGNFNADLVQVQDSTTMIYPNPDDSIQFLNIEEVDKPIYDFIMQRTVAVYIDSPQQTAFKLF